SVDVDSDPRACYFEQVFNGKNMRKALILKLLNDAEADPNAKKSVGEPSAPCTNPRCVSNNERGLEHKAVKTDDGLRCAYCEAAVK
ncbi:MAG: aspartate carbamoyltransferase, partial [Clostridia bacterium]|nr:aspartate carbamoyltransferase [Clostridia bacterium]